MQATEIRDKKTAEEIVQKISSAKLNAVFILVYYWGGKSFFRTDYAQPVNERLRQEDLFTYFIDECHRRGIKVYARFSNGQEGGKGNDGILSTYPHLQIENIRGERMRWFDIGKKEVRELQVKLLGDLLENYPVDGVQLDYIRFPSLSYCYCEECTGNFKNIYGVNPIELYYALPVSLGISSTPLARATRAKIIARLENGVPAISLREDNPGWLLLFNWEINKSSIPFFLQILRRALESEKGLFIPLPRRELGYDEEGFGEILRALRNGTIDYKMIGEIADIHCEESILLLPAVQRLGEKMCAELESFLRSGGKIIVTLGREGIKEGRGYERLLGMEGKGARINGYYLLTPVEKHPLIPVFPDSQEKRRKLLEEWINFRKGLITSFVEEVYKKAKRTNGSLTLSAAVFYNKNLGDKVLQDWYSWLENGVVDFVAPMAYVDDKRLLSALQEWKSYDPHLGKILPGLSIYQLRKGREVPKDKEAVMRQIRIIKNAGAKGFILFSFPFLTDDLAKELAKL